MKLLDIAIMFNLIVSVIYVLINKYDIATYHLVTVSLIMNYKLLKKK